MWVRGETRGPAGRTPGPLAEAQTRTSQWAQSGFGHRRNHRGVARARVHGLGAQRLADSPSLLLGADAPGALLLRACSPHPGGEWGAARSLDPPSSHLLSGGEGVFPPRPHPHPVTGPNRSPEPACTASRLPQGQQCSTSVIKHGLCKPTTCLVSERSQGRPRTCPPSRGTALRHGVRSGGPFRRRCRSSRDAV